MNVKMSSEHGAWVKDDLWLPQSLFSVFQQYWREDPLLIVTSRMNWGVSKDEIALENPPYPVKLVAPLTSVMGMRVRGAEIRHVYPKTEMTAEFNEWWVNEVMCRIQPVEEDR